MAVPVPDDTPDAGAMADSGSGVAMADSGSGPWEVGPGVVRAFLGLGSNLGDRREILRLAVTDLSRPPTVTVVAVSPIYETAPVGGPDGQGPFLNLVVEVAVRPGDAVAAGRPDGDAVAAGRLLLGECHRLEDQAQRVRTVRWGPRTLDVDVLLVGGQSIDDDDLEVPHPRMFERQFVLVPLADLAPKLVPSHLLITPGEIATGETVANAGRL